MAIRHWHPLKLGIIWFIDLAIFLALWLLIAPRGGENQAMVIVVWLVVSLPIFIITWRWATGLQKPAESERNEQCANESTKMEAYRGFSFKRIRVGQIVLLIIVALAGGVSGYLYKQSKIYDYGDTWVEIPDNPAELNDRVGFSPKYSKSIPSDKFVEITSIKTKVKFVTALFNRTWDADLLYRVSLTTNLEKGITSYGDYQVIDPRVGTNPSLASVRECEFYLTFSLYDKDGIFLVGLVGPRDTFTVGAVQYFENNVEEEIPSQMARRTALIQRRVIVDECH